VKPVDLELIRQALRTLIKWNDGLIDAFSVEKFVDNKWQQVVMESYKKDAEELRKENLRAAKLIKELMRKRPASRKGGDE